MPPSVRVKRSPVPSDVPVTKPICRAMSNDVTPIEKPEPTDTDAAAPCTLKYCAGTIAGPPANDQSVTVDGLYVKETVPPTLTGPRTAVSVRPVAETNAADVPGFTN